MQLLLHSILKNWTHHENIRLVIVITEDTILLLQQLQELEEQMLSEEIQSSVYFAHEDSELLQIYQHIGKATTSDQAGSAVEGVVN